MTGGREKDALSPTELWKTSSREIKRIVTALLTLGALLMVLGIVGDGFGWWNSRPFTTNLISGVTGACFAIPLALIGLRALSEAQATYSTRSNNSRGARTDVGNFERRITPYVLPQIDAT